jgi:hypothetical protein
MDPPTPVSSTTPPAPVENPHILWRQVLGFLFWVGPPLFVVGGPIGTGLLLALGGVTFADAWISGIYKRPRERVFVNMSPMAWGIAMALLFIPTYPIYLLNRNKLRTTGGTNDFYWATIGLGALVIVFLVLNLVVRSAMPSR